MRPVRRGPGPVDEQGKARVFCQYADARPYLLSRLGWYCSYCGLPIANAPEVEHVSPKSRHHEIECSWENLLVACKGCNATKGDTDIDLDDYYWPDKHNTAQTFEYLAGGIVTVRGGLLPEQAARAQRTLDLTALDRPDEGRSVRHGHRREAWGTAERSLSNLRDDPTQAMRRQIVLTAAATGFFSVWMTAFRDDPDMLHRSIDAFPGTARECFRDDGSPKDSIERP